MMKQTKDITMFLIVCSAREVSSSEFDLNHVIHYCTEQLESRRQRQGHFEKKTLTPQFRENGVQTLVCADSTTKCLTVLNGTFLVGSAPM